METEIGYHVTHLECAKTGEHLPAGEIHNLSPAGAPILVRYDLDAARSRQAAARR